MSGEKKERTLECALHYIAMGWQVIPLYTIIEDKCTCGKPDCPSPGKHPHGKLAPNGAKDATNDKTIIASSCCGKDFT